MKTLFPSTSSLGWTVCFTMPLLWGKGFGSFVAAHLGQRNHWKASWITRPIVIHALSRRLLVSKTTVFHVSYLTSLHLTLYLQCWDFEGVAVRFTAYPIVNTPKPWRALNFQTVFHIFKYVYFLSTYCCDARSPMSGQDYFVVRERPIHRCLWEV